MGHEILELEDMESLLLSFFVFVSEQSLKQLYSPVMIQYCTYINKISLIAPWLTWTPRFLDQTMEPTISYQHGTSKISKESQASRHGSDTL